MCPSKKHTVWQEYYVQGETEYPDRLPVWSTAFILLTPEQQLAPFLSTKKFDRNLPWEGTIHGKEKHIIFTFVTSTENGTTHHTTTFDRLRVCVDIIPLRPKFEITNSYSSWYLVLSGHAGCARASGPVSSFHILKTHLLHNLCEVLGTQCCLLPGECDCEVGGECNAIVVDLWNTTVHQTHPSRSPSGPPPSHSRLQTLLPTYLDITVQLPEPIQTLWTWRNHAKLFRGFRYHFFNSIISIMLRCLIRMKGVSQNCAKYMVDAQHFKIWWTSTRAKWERHCVTFDTQWGGVSLPILITMHSDTPTVLNWVKLPSALPSLDSKKTLTSFTQFQSVSCILKLKTTGSICIHSIC